MSSPTSVFEICSTHVTYRPSWVDAVDTSHSLCSFYNRHSLDRYGVAKALASAIDDTRSKYIALDTMRFGLFDYDTIRVDSLDN